MTATFKAHAFDNLMQLDERFNQQLQDLAMPAADAIAVRWDHGSMDFASLSTAVGSLAAYLEATCIPAAVVALMMERSPQLLIAQLACLRSRRPFLLLPSSGHYDLSGLLADAAVSLVLFDRPDTPAARSGSIRRADVDTIVRDAAHGAALAPITGDPQDVAYIIHTSGSTGKPKAIAVTRAGLANYLGWAAKYYNMQDLEGAVAQLNSSFDASITQLLLPLLTGRTVYLISTGGEVVHLVNTARSLSGRWLLKLTPSQLPAIAAECDGQAFDLIEGELVVGGEALLASHVDIARQLFPGFNLHNEYGPSETVVGSTIYTVPASGPSCPSIPIGQAIDATATWILDAQDQVCATGETGELCIGGVGIARGYVGQPALTAQRFVPALPGYGLAPGARMYRTGDFVQLGADAQLLYHGRRDGQVKIRGHRVELGDVQVRVEKLQGVAQATAGAQRDTHGELALVAFVRLDAGIDLIRVQARAADDIPSQLLPSRWITVTAFPLTSNGKIDNAALQALMDTPQAEALSGAPQDPLRASLRTIWNALLGHNNFDDDQSFFAVGGHSILAVKLRAMLRKQLGADLTLSELLALPTLNSQASMLRERAAPVAALTSPPAAPLRFALSLYQQPLWLAVRQAARSGTADPYTVAGALTIEGTLDLARLQAACALVVRRHGVFYTCFEDDGQRMGPEPRWTWQADTTPKAMALAQLAQQSTQPFDLQDGPLLRIRLWHTGGDVYLMLWQAHHLVTDQWTMQLLLDQTLRAYSGSADSAPAAPLDAYASFSARQHMRAENGEYAEQLANWQKHLAPPLVCAPLPTLLNPLRRFQAQRSSIVLPEAVSAQIAQRAASLGITLNAAALAIIGIALGMSTGLSTVRLVGAVTARDDAGLEDVAGYFLNSVPFQVHPADARTLTRVLQETGDEVRFALANKDIPFAMLTAAIPALLDAACVHGRYVFVSSSLEDIVIPGCSVSELALPSQPGLKFDLLIAAAHTRDGLAFHFDFDPGVFATADVTSWCEAVKLAAALVAQEGTETVADSRQRLLDQQSQAQQDALIALSRRLPPAQRRAAAPTGALGHEAARISSPEWLRGALLVQAPSQATALATWLVPKRDWLSTQLRQHGAMLLRDFRLEDAAAFEAVTALLGDEGPSEYENRSTPRTRVYNNIFTSTEYPASETIAQHNENSYSNRWPARLAFWCRRAAPSGGETPIADSRRIWSALSESTRAAFLSKGVTYVRNYGKAGLSWQETFQTSDAAEVERYCRTNQISWRWGDDGRLRTSQTTAAVRRHAYTGETVWFNQAHLFHVSSLGRETADALISVYGYENLPRHALFGDGSQIDEAYLDDIRAAYNAHAVALPWRDSDVAILDNMLYSHGRLPYRGERSVLVGMTGMMSADDCEPV